MRTSLPDYMETVHRLHALARKAGLETMPRLFLWDMPYVNAGSRDSETGEPFVSLSIGALLKLDDDALLAVMAHELGHIVNGDIYGPSSWELTGAEQWAAEFKADAFAAKLVSKAAMISALRKTKEDADRFGLKTSTMHPPIPERIARLEALA